MTPHQGGASSEARWQLSPVRGQPSTVLRGFGGDRQLFGNGPHEARAGTGQSDGDDVCLCASGHQGAGSWAPPAVGWPAEILAHLGWCGESSWPMSAPLGGSTVGPGAFHACPSGLGGASLGERALGAALPGGIGRREQPQALHQCSWGGKAGQVAHGGAPGDGHRAVHATERREGFNHRGQTPGTHVRLAFLVETLAALGMCRDRPALFLADALLRRGRADDRREPPEMGRAPLGLAALAESVAEPKSFEAHLGGHAGAAGSFTGPRARPHGFLFPRGAREHGELARARQAGQWHGGSAVGCDAVTGLWGKEGGSHAPAGLGFVRQGAGEPGAPRAGCRDEEARWGL